MGIVFRIGVVMVTSVGRAPAEDRSLDGHRTQDSQGGHHDRAGTERLVGEVPVVSHGDPHAGQDVHHRHEHELRPVDPGPPHVHDADDQTDDGEQDGEEVGDPAAQWKPGVAVQFRLEGLLRRRRRIHGVLLLDDDVVGDDVDDDVADDDDDGVFRWWWLMNGDDDGGDGGTTVTPLSTEFGQGNTDSEIPNVQEQ